MATIVKSPITEVSSRHRSIETDPSVWDYVNALTPVDRETDVIYSNCIWRDIKPKYVILNINDEHVKLILE